MIWNPFKAAPGSFLGVDIGTSAVKIVELSKFGDRKKLENYGEMRAASLYEKPFRTFEKSTLTVASNDVAKAILAVIREAKMKSSKAYFSIPDFSSFFTNFQLPAMTEEELPLAVQYEARQHIPLPSSEVTLDWQIIGEKIVSQKVSDFNILLVAVPNEAIWQYQEIARLSRLELLALEAEVFGLARALIGEEKEVLILVDIGARSTTVSIADSGTLKVSHSFDTSGNDLTNLIAKGFNLSYEEAEAIKKKQGLLPSKENIREALLPLIDLIINEVKKISQNFYRAEGKSPQKIILAGGSALLPGLPNYFSENLGNPVEIANPFSSLYYPPVLEETLKEMGPSYAIAVGTALRGLE